MANFTKEAIKSTFITLLDTTPLNQITVKMIVEKCGINRNSFYYHYEDLPALINEVIMDEADRIISQHPDVDSLETALEAALDFASENRRAILNIYNSLNRDIFEQYLWKVCDHVVSAYARTIAAASSVSPEDLEIIKRFYRCECFGVVMDWLQGGMNFDVRKQVERFCVLHQGIPEKMLHKAEA